MATAPPRQFRLKDGQAIIVRPAVEADAEGRVRVDMTLTSPACPSAQQLPSEVRFKVKAIEGVKDCAVEVVWEPPWTKDMMSETAKLTLGMF